MENKWNEIFKFLTEKTYPDGCSKGQKVNLKRYAEKFTVKNGELFYKNRRAIKDREETWKLFKEFHSSPMGGHTGIIKTRHALCSRFYWHGMTVQIDKWVSECDKCQREGKPLAAMVPLQNIKVSAVWELVGIDLTGPLPTTPDGYQYILTATDYFSKWVEAYPLKTKSAAEVAQKLCSIIYRLGCPKRILSDQGREFVNELNTTLCDLMHIERSVTAAYHPQTNGLDEKTNHNIKRALMKVVNDRQNNWDIYLEATLFSLRSKPQSSTKHTPFKLMYGREAVFPAEVPVDIPLSIVLPEEEDVEEFVTMNHDGLDTSFKIAKDNISKAQLRQSLAYGKRKLKKYKGFQYSVGQEVLLFNSRKQGRKGGRLEPDFTGPYTIHEISGKNVLLVNADGVVLKNRHNIDHVKPYKRDPDMVGPPNKRPHLEEQPTRPSIIMYAPPRQLMVLDAYIHVLHEKHQKVFYHLNAVVAASLFVRGRMQTFVKMKFPAEDQWLCPVNVGAHWILVVVSMLKKALVLIDPLSNECRYKNKILKNWRKFLGKVGRDSDEWSVNMMVHNKQEDSSSCGILVLMFAEAYLVRGNVGHVSTAQQDIARARMNVACSLLQRGGNEDYCVVCSLHISTSGREKVQCSVCKRSAHVLCNHGNEAFMCKKCQHAKSQTCV